MLMSMIEKFFKDPRKQKESESKSLARYFHDLEGSPDFPYTLALKAYDNLKESAQGQEELFYFLMEDCIFTSLYATFYEQLLIAVKENNDVAIPLIDRFADDSEERERMIAEQTQYHLSFIENKGLCPGCPCCENHQDVAELITYWQKGDIDFFTNLYIGMQTIQFAMEHLIYDVIPSTNNVIGLLNHESILEFRQYIFDYSEERGM
ncbi:hypothetical protein BMS_1328 [Halobacteriovorax marinus SJ]|uniref:Uncharacterized protein n=2 Tax=Halobacteriovorax marinus TaxID=97084 RepID=E1WZL2_HALMS|nr:hypothetical protein BMS_1328 [Halobacteriovorax marinus SJ]